MKRLFPAILGVLVSASALGAMPPFTWDDVLVARSDAMVVGHVEAGFAVRDTVPKAYSAIGMHVTDYYTVLIVTRVIQGKIPPGPTSVIIHGALKPVVLDTKTPVQQQMGESCPVAGPTTGPQVPVGLFYPSTVIGMPPTEDIRKDQIWFLRKTGLNPNAVEEVDDTALGVRWQQDVQPLAREGYFRAILSGDPEALAPFTKGDAWPAREARIVQDRLRVRRTDRIADHELRADALMAILQAQAPFSPVGQLAMEKLTALGPTGLKKLVPLFQNAGHDYDRRAILQAWRSYAPAGPVLAEWLNGENQWWSQEGPQNMVWSFQVGQRGGPDYNDPRAVSNRNIYCTVGTLADLDGAKARAVITSTRAQWAALPIRPDPGNDIVAACDQALGQLNH